MAGFGFSNVAYVASLVPGVPAGLAPLVGHAHYASFSAASLNFDTVSSVARVRFELRKATPTNLVFLADFRLDEDAYVYGDTVYNCGMKVNGAATTNPNAAMTGDWNVVEFARKIEYFHLMGRLQAGDTDPQYYTNFDIASITIFDAAGAVTDLFDMRHTTATTIPNLVAGRLALRINGSAPVEHDSPA